MGTHLQKQTYTLQPVSLVKTWSGGDIALKIVMFNNRVFQLYLVFSHHMGQLTKEMRERTNLYTRFSRTMIIYVSIHNLYPYT